MISSSSSSSSSSIVNNIDMIDIATISMFTITSIITTAAEFIGWANHHFNNLRFRNSLETKTST